MTTRMDIRDLLIWAFRDEDVENRESADPDAVLVLWAVRALPAPHATAIRYFARAATMPDWHAGPGHMVSLTRVRHARRLYSEWVRALVVLQGSLDGRLERYSVSGPALDDAPWEALRLSA